MQFAADTASKLLPLFSLSLRIFTPFSNLSITFLSLRVSALHLILAKRVADVENKFMVTEGKGRKEIEVTRKRRAGVKREETNLVSNHSIRVLQSPEHPERFTELIEKRKGR